VIRAQEGTLSSVTDGPVLVAHSHCEHCATIHAIRVLRFAAAVQNAVSLLELTGLTHLPIQAGTIRQVGS
jgi:hypothetical protein